MTTLTSGFGSLIVGLADELAVLHEVELVAGVELPAAHEAGKAVQVVHVFLCSPHHLSRGDTLLTRSTFRAKPPENTA